MNNDAELNELISLIFSTISKEEQQKILKKARSQYNKIVEAVEKNPNLRRTSIEIVLEHLLNSDYALELEGDTDSE